MLRMSAGIRRRGKHARGAKKKIDVQAHANSSRTARRRRYGGQPTVNGTLINLSLDMPMSAIIG